MVTRILLIEDSETDIELIREALTDSGLDHHLDVARDGEEALRLLKYQTIHPDLILLDLNMPKLSGIDVLKQLRQDNPPLGITPVIVLTNSKSRDDVYGAYASGANAYVRKPLGFDKILEAIKSIGKFWVTTATIPSKANGQSYGPPKSS